MRRESTALKNYPETMKVDFKKDFDINRYREELKEHNLYAAELRKTLPKFVFKPVPGRLVWAAVHYTIVAISIIGIINLDHWYTDLFFSLLMGHSLGCVFFLGHEVAHGSVVKNKKLIVFFSSLCFAHWGLHGNAWINWHNRKHHHITNHPYKDPDCFGKKHTRYKMMLTMQDALPGSGKMISYVFLFWFFSFFAFNIIWFMPRIFVSVREKIIARLFSFLVYTTWVPIATMAQPLGFVFLFLIPLLISNFVIMSYIATNHFLSPLTEDTNDPLANSLTVKANKLFDFLHMNFSYHIEHHVVPYVSPKYAPLVANALKEKYPDKYKEMKHRRALKLLYSRPRFYKDDIRLLNPRTGEVHPTVLLDDFLG